MSPNRGREAAPSAPMVESLTAAAGRGARAALIALLQDVVDDGASVGFLPPLSVAEGGRVLGRRLRCRRRGRAAALGRANAGR